MAMKADGSGARTLARGVTISPPLRWSPDGTKLAFAMLRTPDSEGLYVVDAVSGRSRRITVRNASEDESDGYQAWSPDGRKIVFDTDNDGEHDIRVVNADGTGERRILKWSYRGSHLIEGLLTGGDAWSSDGRRILYVDGSGRLTVMAPDGSRRRPLQPTAWGSDSGSGYVSWSPDGRSIVFVANDGIAVANADGTGLHRLVPNGVAPVWSPDGRKIAFTRSGRVFVVNRDGSGLHKVGRTGELPAWSPDGRWIAYASYCNGNGDIYVVEANGSHERRLTNTKLEEAGPVWSPAG
ncbi:MAG: hypothetical protein ACXVRJ_11950 [Gaiellaceae bacterium]